LSYFPNRVVLTKVARFRRWLRAAAATTMSIAPPLQKHASVNQVRWEATVRCSRAAINRICPGGQRRSLRADYTDERDLEVIARATA